VPEIIEVDFLRQEINDQLIDRVVVDAFLNKEKASNLRSSEFKSKLKGTTLLGARRKGKVLIIDFSHDVSLVVHFLLTGFMRLASPCEKDKFQAGIIFTNDCLVIGGLMGTACVNLVDSKKVFEDKALKGLGIDALSPEFNFNAFKELVMVNQKKNIKQLLTDQSLIAGIGNAYSDEILFEAKVHPLRRCNSFDEREIEKIYGAILGVFEEARKYGGESELSFVHLNGQKGKMQEHFKVHKREGEVCPACGGKVASLKANGRTSFFCPECQKLF
jgi:formamidopyrimidine-DNA glycosylase